MIGSANVTSCLVKRTVDRRFASLALTLNKFDQPVADYIFCPWPKQPYALMRKTQLADTWDCKDYLNAQWLAIGPLTTNDRLRATEP
jgi:hypothetical protein